MSIVDDLNRMQQGLADIRYPFEAVWAQIISLTRPTMAHQYKFGGYGLTTGQSLSGTNRLTSVDTKASSEMFNTALAWGADRLSAGMESLISPRNQKWHGLAADVAFGQEATDIEEEFFDKTRDYLFTARYGAKAGFSLANQKAIWETTTLGTGILFTEENLNRRRVDPVKHPVFYRHIPLNEIYLRVNAYGEIDGFVRIFELSASAAVQRFGEGKLSAKVKQLADDMGKSHELVTFGLAVIPREEADGYDKKKTAFEYAAFTWEIETKHLVKHGGYFDFPLHVMHWDQMGACPYGHSDVMTVLPEAKMLQVMSKASVQTMQQWIKPPLATAAQGLQNRRLNMNSGAVNPGYIDDNGNMMVRPINTSQDPSAALQMIQNREETINKGLKADLFQTLVDHPNMTATEAIIRNTEKGELLGPAGAKIETAYGRMVDREIDIIDQKGAFEPGTPLEAPESLAGADIGVKFTGPLARLRRLEEVNGIQQVTQMAGVFGEYDESIIDRLDADDSLEIIREVSGAPRRMFRTDEEVDEIRTQKAQQKEAMAALQMGEMAANAMGKATPALQAMNEANAA